jgi:hypothetical protein
VRALRIYLLTAPLRRVLGKMVRFCWGRRRRPDKAATRPSAEALEDRTMTGEAALGAIAAAQMIPEQVNGAALPPQPIQVQTATHGTALPWPDGTAVATSDAAVPAWAAQHNNTTQEHSGSGSTTSHTEQGVDPFVNFPDPLGLNNSQQHGHAPASNSQPTSDSSATHSDGGSAGTGGGGGGGAGSGAGSGGSASGTGAGQSSGAGTTALVTGDNTSATPLTQPSSHGTQAATGTAAPSTGTAHNSSSGSSPAPRNSSSTAGSAVAPRFSSSASPSPPGGGKISGSGAGKLALFEGNSGGGVLATFTDSSNPSSGSASVTWGDGSSSVATVSNQGKGVFAVSGTHAYADEGNFVVTVTFSDPTGSASVTDTAAVSDASLHAASLPVSTAAGVSFTAPLASLSDGNPLGSVADFSSVGIDWGDHSAVSTGTVQASSGAGQFKVLGTHRYALPGTYQTQLTIQDRGGASTQVTSQVIVSAPLVGGGGSGGHLFGPQGSGGAGQIEGNVAGPLQLVEGQQGSGNVAGFRDSDGDTNPAHFTATAQLTTPTGPVWLHTQISGPLAGYLLVSIQDTVSEEGTYPLHISITDTVDANTPVWNGDSQVVVSDAALSVQGNQVTLTGTTSSAVYGVLGFFGDADPNGTASDYSAQVSWGDQSPLTAATVSAAAGGGFQVSVSSSLSGHQYATARTFAGNVLVKDNNNPQTQVLVPFQANIGVVGGGGGGGRLTANPPAQQPTFTEGVLSPNVVLATFTDGDGNTNPAAYNVSVNWGDNTAATPRTAMSRSSTSPCSGNSSSWASTTMPRRASQAWW